MLRLIADLVPAYAHVAATGRWTTIAPRWCPERALRRDGGERLSRDTPQGARSAVWMTPVRSTRRRVFHAGTDARRTGPFADGGRVLNVCASGKTVAEAQARAYAAVDRIKWPDGFCRRDIGWQAVERRKRKISAVIPDDARCAWRLRIPSLFSVPHLRGFFDVQLHIVVRDASHRPGMTGEM